MNDYQKYFEKLYVDYLHKVEFYAYNYLQDMDMARSVAQESFLTIWERKKEMDWEHGTVKYLFVITRNNCINILRKRVAHSKFSKYSRERDLVLNMEALEKDSSISLYSEELNRLVVRAMKKMTVKVRETFLLSKVSGLKNREIAEKLNISLSTVECRLTVAYRILRIALKDYLPFLLWFLLPFAY